LDEEASFVKTGDPVVQVLPTEERTGPGEVPTTPVAGSLGPVKGE
jgi:hypothetical protein